MQDSQLNPSNSMLSVKNDKKFKPLKLHRKEYKLENAIDRKAKRINVQRPLGIWECLKIHGSPDELVEQLKFSQQKASIKKYHMEIKDMLNDLKK